MTGLVRMGWARSADNWASILISTTEAYLLDSK